MVERAHHWLESFGNGLSQQGFPSLGEGLLKHAKEEVGHDRWHRADVETLVKMYNVRYGAHLEAGAVLKEGDSPCVEQYRVLNEETASGADVFLSLAVLYETEILTFELAPEFIGECVAECGFGILQGMKFLKGHLVSDADHIRDNVEQLSEFLARSPDALPSLVAAGKQTIDVYDSYFNQVCALAHRQLSPEAFAKKT